MWVIIGCFTLCLVSWSHRCFIEVPVVNAAYLRTTEQFLAPPAPPDGSLRVYARRRCSHEPLFERRAVKPMGAEQTIYTRAADV